MTDEQAKAIVLAHAEKIAAILKVPVSQILNDLAKGKDSKLLKYLHTHNQ